MLLNRGILYLTFALFAIVPYGKGQQRFEVNGYVSGIGQGTHSSDTNAVTQYASELVLHQRLNMEYHYGTVLSAYAGARNLLHAGSMVTLNSYYADIYNLDNGYIDLNFNWIDQPNWFLTTQIDRLYVNVTHGPLEVSVGRMRINWARAMVWNPNDIFNTYSYYDIDYMERPGTDAVKMLYYANANSLVEAVAKLDSAHRLTSALQYKTNHWGYDLQLIGGYAYGSDWVTGFGWEGQLKNIGFRGEMTYYQPAKNFADTLGAMLASVGFDYIWQSGLMLQFEALYNSPKTLLNITSAVGFFGAPASAKSLSFAEYNLFGNILYPLNPIINLSMAGMIYNRYHGWFAMPGIDISAANNLNVGCFYQYFSFKPTGTRLVSGYGMVRVKWSF